MMDDEGATLVPVQDLQEVHGHRTWAGDGRDDAPCRRCTREPDATDPRTTSCVTARRTLPRNRDHRGVAER